MNNGSHFIFWLSSKLPDLNATVDYAKEAQEEQQIKAILAICCVVIILLSVGAAYYLRTTHNFRKGDWGRMKAKTSVNRYRAMINISMSVARCDRTNIHTKVHEINKFLVKRYGDFVTDATSDIVSAMYGTSGMATTVPWLAAQISPEERTELLVLLFRVATSDPVLGSRERLLMNEYCRLADVNPGILAELEIHFFQQQAERESHSRSAAVNENSHHERALMLLGLTPEATELDLRKSYRSLVKKLHPDRYPHESPQRKKELQAQFIDVQAAYEYLSNRIA